MEALQIERSLGNREGIADTLFQLGNVATSYGDYGAAHAHLAESLSLYRTLGNKYGIAWSQSVLAYVMLQQDGVQMVSDQFVESLVIFTELGDKRGRAVVIYGLGEAALRRGDAEAAHALFAESLACFRTLNDKWFIGMCLQGLAGVFVVQAQSVKAVTVLAAVTALRAAIGAPLPRALFAVYDRYVAMLRPQFEEATWTALWTRGQAMSLEEAVAYALDEATRE
jgi:tetratricopeptide (TPR) repeat protein